MGQPMIYWPKGAQITQVPKSKYACKNELIDIIAFEAIQKNEQECIMSFSNFTAYLSFRTMIWKITNFLEFWFWLYIALYNVCNVPVLSPFSMPLSRMYWIIFRYCNSSCFPGFTFSSLIGNVEDSGAELSKPSTANIFRRCDPYCQQMKRRKKIPNCRVAFILLIYLQIVKNHQVTFHCLC